MNAPSDDIYPQLPAPPVLEAIGTVAIRHSEHEDVLKMLIRTFLHQEAEEARRHIGNMPISRVRDKVSELGRAIFGPGEVLNQLEALLSRGEQLSNQRNQWVHALYGVDWLDQPLRRDKHGNWVDQPTPEQLINLAQQLDALTHEIRHARSHGFMAAALVAKGYRVP